MNRLLIVFLISLVSFNVSAKVCKKGQPCGNSCISWSKTCHKSYTSSTSYTSNVTSSISTSKYNSNSSSAYQEPSNDHYVTATTLNVRNSPELTGKILGTLLKGQAVRVKQSYSDWSLIYYKNSFGWVSSKYII